MTHKIVFENPLEHSITIQQEPGTLALLRRILREQKEGLNRMATITEAIEAVKQAATEEREEVRVALEGLKTTIDDLREQLAGGTAVTDEQLQEFKDAVEGVLHPEDIPA